MSHWYCTASGCGCCPLGVFTPLRWQDRRVARHSEAVVQVKRSLQQCGFELHHNATEALQIHCDYRPR